MVVLGRPVAQNAAPTVVFGGQTLAAATILGRRIIFARRPMARRSGGPGSTAQAEAPT